MFTEETNADVILTLAARLMGRFFGIEIQDDHFILNLCYIISIYIFSLIQLDRPG